MFFMGEYASMLAVSGIATTLWFGGWHSPFPASWPLNGLLTGYIPGGVIFLGKMFVFFFIYVWLRASLPRLRYDALMNIGWKKMLPFSLVFLFITAIWATYRMPEQPHRDLSGGNGLKMMSPSRNGTGR